MKRLSLLPFTFIAALVPTMAWAAQVTDEEALPPPPEQPPDPVSSSVLDGVLAMSTESMLMLVAGVVMSLLSSVVIKQGWSDDIKALIYFVVCLGFGLVYTMTLDDWSTTDMARRVLLVFVTGTLFYKLFQGPMTQLTMRTDSLTSGFSIRRN